MRRALVLGASGFIGGAIARHAVETGWEVRAFRRRPGFTGAIADVPVEWVRGDLQDEAGLRRAMRGVQVLFHAAGYYPTHGRRIPAQVAFAAAQTRRVLRAAFGAGVERVVYTSSLTTISAPPPGEERLADERDAYLPGSLARSAYYECKYAMESEALRAAAMGQDVVVLNPTLVLGPGDVHLAVSRILLAVARGRVIAWLPGETNVIDVRDAAAAHVRAAQVGRSGERTILGGHNVSVQDLLREAAAAAGSRAPRFEIPLWLVDSVVALDDLLPFLSLGGNHLRAVRRWCAYDTSKAQRELGLAPRPLSETLRDAFAWLRDFAQLDGG